MSATVQHREQIARKWFPSSGTAEVNIVRVVSLSDDLTEIETRRLTRVEVRIGTPLGMADKDAHTVPLDREALLFLRDTFDAALQATAEFADEVTP